MTILSWQKLLVYRLAPETPYPSTPVPAGFEFKRIEPADLDRFFGRQPALHALFAEFLRLGHIGVLAHAGDRWAAYSWTTVPRGPAPPHLPHAFGGMEAVWFFYAHTHPDFRRRGLITYMKELKIRLLPPGPRGRCEILADTLEDNAVSQRSLRTAGFEPAGVIRYAALFLPRLGRLCWARWDQGRIHPRPSVGGLSLRRVPRPSRLVTTAP